MIVLPIEPWHGALILVGIIATAYYVGRKLGFHEGVNGMAETLVALEILTREDLQKLIERAEDYDE